MNICQTPGCQAITGALFTGADWIEYCPVCGAGTALQPPRTPDEADRVAGTALHQMQDAHYADAEEGFLSAAASMADRKRKAFYLWLSLLCRYGVSYVEEVQFANIPSKRTSLFLPTFGRFPLPDTDIRSAAACRELEKLPTAYAASGIHDRITELDSLLKEIRGCLKKVSNRSDVFIAWHDDDAQEMCRGLADKINSRLALSKECYSFVSFKDLPQYTVDHYESHIYAALAAAKVMVIVIRNYDALGQKFLALELKRFLSRKQNEPHLRIYFCGMNDHIGAIPAPLQKSGLQCHRDNCEDNVLWAELICKDVLDILREQRRMEKAAASIELPPAQATPVRDPIGNDLIWVRFQLSCKNWANARERLAELNRQYPARGEIYLYMLLAEYQLSEKNQLIHVELPYEETPYWQFAYRTADDALRSRMDTLLADTKAERERKAQEAAAAEEAVRMRREQEEAATRAAVRAAAEEAERLRKEQEAVAKAAAKAAAEEAERQRRLQEAAEKAAAAAAKKSPTPKHTADEMLYSVVKETIAENEAAKAAAEEAERRRRERDAAFTREAVEKSEHQRREREAKEAERRKAAAEEAERQRREQQAAAEAAERRRRERETAAQAAQRVNQKLEEENRAALAAIKAKQEADDKLYRIVKEHISGNQASKPASAPMQQRLQNLRAASDAAVEKQHKEQTSAAKASDEAKRAADDKLYRIVKEHISGNQASKPASAPMQQRLQNLRAASDAAVEKQRSQSPRPAPKPTPLQMETASRLLKAKGITCERLPSGIALVKGTGYTGRHLEIPEGVTLIGDMAFWKFFNMKTLESVTFPATLTCIGSDAFSYCTSLTNVVIPDGVTLIGKAAFAGCAKLKQITLPAGLKTLSANTFKWCNQLTEVTVPEGVVTIEAGAFESCGGLKTVRIPASVTAMGEGIKEKVFVNTRNVTVITPKGSNAEIYCRTHNIPYRNQ